MARIDSHLARLKARNYDWPVPWAVVDALGRKEDCRLTAYLCSAAVPTIGWGETEGIQLGMRWTEDQADARFYQQVVRFTRAVEAMATSPTTRNQLGGLVMLAYNIGLRRDKPTKAGLFHSTVLRLHNAGDYLGASNAFRLYNKARNPVTKQLEVVGGLVARRALEASIYLTPDEDAPAPRMPQAVEPESSLSASPLVKIGATLVGSGGAAGVFNETAPAPAAAGMAQAAATAQQAGEVASQVSGVASTVTSTLQSVASLFGITPGTLVALAVVAAGAAVIYWRHRQRREGWA